MKTHFLIASATAAVLLTGACSTSPPLPNGIKQSTYQPGKLKPTDSNTTLRPGDPAPVFSLPSLSGKTISLAQFRGKKNVVLSFVPAAFTPVCSSQFPGYNISLDLFEQHDAVLLGITTDNLPSLHAWRNLMGGLDFELLSDFWPHGKVAKQYGILRQDGTSERALVVIDQQGVIRYMDVHDINQRPPLEDLAKALGQIQ